VRSGGIDRFRIGGTDQEEGFFPNEEVKTTHNLITTNNIDVITNVFAFQPFYL